MSHTTARQHAEGLDQPIWHIRLRHPGETGCDPPGLPRGITLELYVPATAWPSWRATMHAVEDPHRDYLCPRCLKVLVPNGMDLVRP